MDETLDTEMRGSSIAASAMFHAAALILVTISLPFLKKNYEAPQPIAIELVTIDKISQTTKPSAQPAPKPPEKKVEEKKPEDKKPPPAPTSKAETPQPPVEKPPEKVEKPETKPVEKVIDENAPPEKKVPRKVVKKPPVKKEEPKKDFSSLLKNLVDVKEKLAEQQPPVTPDKMAKADDGQPLPLGDRMTMNENAALIKQLEGCWDVPYGAKDAANTTVDVYMVINQDRTLASAQVSDTGRYNSDSFFRVMADSALRAVRNPLCSPFDLPPDKYESWKTITVTFDPSQMF